MYGVDAGFECDGIWLISRKAFARQMFVVFCYHLVTSVMAFVLGRIGILLFVGREGV